MKKFIDAYQDSAGEYGRSVRAGSGVLRRARFRGCCGIWIRIPFSSIPGQFEQLKQMESSDAEGVRHAWCRCCRAAWWCCRLMPDTLSEKAGMTPGDEILAVNNYRLDRLDAEQIVGLLNAIKAEAGATGGAASGQCAAAELTLVPETMKSSSVERVFRTAAGHRIHPRIGVRRDDRTADS